MDGPHTATIENGQSARSARQARSLAQKRFRQREDPSQDLEIKKFSRHKCAFCKTTERPGIPLDTKKNREGKGLSRPFARLIDDLFALDQRVRYVAVLDRNHRLVESRMRTHVASFTPEEYDRKFMGSVPPLVLDTLSQLEGQCGPLSHISVQYEKVDLIFIPHNNQIIALSLETGPLEPILRKLRDSLGVHIHL